MLDVLEIVDGAILATVYLVPTLFVPLALFAAAAAIVATVIRIPLKLVPGLRGQRDTRPPVLVGVFRGVIVGVIPFAVAATGLVAALGRLTSPASTDLVDLLVAGARDLIVLLAGIQDAAFRGWTGLAPAEVIARASAAEGFRPLGVLTQLVGAHLATFVGAIAPETQRIAFAIAVAALTLLALGVSPLRALRSVRRHDDEAARRLSW